MIIVPDTERKRFASLLQGESQRYGLNPREYLQKVWYHEEAAKLGEYVAMVLMNELLQSLPINETDELQSQ